jgi:carbon storage regulator CsrA
MLVLSRGRNDKIVFPNLGITVEVLNIASNKVRIGVDAPSDVTVLRHELADKGGPAKPREASGESPRKLSHAVRNRLNTATLALHLAQKQLQSGNLEMADKMLQRGLAEFAELDKQAAPPAKARRADSRGHTLIVEDNANEGELLASYLRMNGFRVDTARDGHDALRMLEAELRPDAVLLDMRMPHCDGPATISAIRANPAWQDLKVFAVTGAAPGSLDVQQGSAGVNGWFQKPVNPEKLVRELTREIADALVV